MNKPVPETSAGSPDLRSDIEDLLPTLVKLRHELHQHPEIRFEEHWTSDRIAQFLDGIGVPYERGYAKGTGIVATLSGKGDRTVALRADIDALEIQEQTGLPYASTIPNRMHACGHDGHTTVLCGAIAILAKHRETLRGNVKFVFQPAEEIAGGGRLIVEEGVLDGVDAVFALHGWPTLPLGSIGVKNGCLLASATDFHITVHGHGCHGAQPSNGVDSVLVAAHITTALQSIVSREIKSSEPAVVTVGHIEGGAATNVIPETAGLHGTFRSLNDRTHERIREAIERIATSTALAFRATASVQFGDVTYPALHNDDQKVDFVRETVRDILGHEHLTEMDEPSMGAEDFAFYLQKVPGAFFLLGVNPDSSSPYPSLHNPHYDFNDEALFPGIQMMASLAYRFLDAKT